MVLRKLRATGLKEEKRLRESVVLNGNRDWWVNLFGCGMLPLLFLLLSLNLQLVLHVLDVPSKAVAMEVVVTGCFRKGLIFLERG